MYNSKKKSSIDELLNLDKPILMAGAHDALSAKLAEAKGFNSIWVSGFGISLAQKAIPDANLVTMTELLDYSKNINNAVSIPVIADCDNGFGNALNVIRTVQEFESIGLAGICIEDNVFPKQCSFYDQPSRELVNTSEFQGKIRAAIEARRSSEFKIIARTEAFIAGRGEAEALERAKAYDEAGADAILVHSKKQTFEELEGFSKKWNGSKPLVIVPTKFPHTPVSEMFDAGYSIIIYANQAVRAAFNSIEQTMEYIVSDQTASFNDSEIASLEKVFEFINVEELNRAEEKYLNFEKRSVST